MPSGRKSFSSAERLITGIQSSDQLFPSQAIPQIGQLCRKQRRWKDTPEQFRVTKVGKLIGALNSASPGSPADPDNQKSHQGREQVNGKHGILVATHHADTFWRMKEKIKTPDPNGENEPNFRISPKLNKHSSIYMINLYPPALALLFF